MRMLMLPRGHLLRPAAERLIAEVYARCYSARVPAFPEMLVTTMDSDGHPVCAAALRFATDGFFSECYLDAPIQTVLKQKVPLPLGRDRIFEVTSLASRTPHLAGSFLRAIVARGEDDGFEWAFFTATERLKSLLERMRLPLFYLAEADQSRVADPHAWGTYYKRRPGVYAVHRAGARLCLKRQSLVAVHG
jgi:hypothetical protein